MLGIKTSFLLSPTLFGVLITLSTYANRGTDWNWKLRAFFVCQRIPEVFWAKNNQLRLGVMGFVGVLFWRSGERRTELIPLGPKPSSGETERTPIALPLPRGSFSGILNNPEMKCQNITVKLTNSPHDHTFFYSLIHS